MSEKDKSIVPPVDTKHDALLFSLSQQHADITSLLQTFFSFLERRTDFFHVQKTPDEKIGFPDNYAHTLVEKVFYYYKNRYEERQLKNCIKKLPIGLSERSLNSSVEKKLKNWNKPFNHDSNTNEPCSEPKMFIHGIKPLANDVAQSAPNTVPSVIKKETHKSNTSHISAWNGKITEKYIWTQTMNDVTVEVFLPCIPVFNSKAEFENSLNIENPEILSNPHQLVTHLKDEKGLIGFTYCSPKNIAIKLMKDSIKINIEHVSNNLENYVPIADLSEPKTIQLFYHMFSKNQVLLEGRFLHSVSPFDYIWNIDSRTLLILSVDKIQNMWWTCFLIGDDSEIDGTTIESKKRLEEFDEPTQKQIRNLIIEHQMQRSQPKTF